MRLCRRGGFPGRPTSGKGEARKSDEQHRSGRRLGDRLRGDRGRVPDEASAAAAAVGPARVPRSASHDVQFGPHVEKYAATHAGAVAAGPKPQSALRADRGDEVESSRRDRVLNDGSGQVENREPDDDIAVTGRLPGAPLKSEVSIVSRSAGLR